MSIGNFANQAQYPGLSTDYQTATRDITWGRAEWLWNQSCQISGAARDAGNDVTTILRPGLLLGKITSSNLMKEWNPNGTDGSERIAGVLGSDLSVQILAANAPKFTGNVLLSGGLKAASLLIGGNASYGIASDSYEILAREQLAALGFKLDDKPNFPAGGYPYRKVITATSMTLTVADHATMFVMNQSGAHIVTLPVMVPGFRAKFYQLADQSLTLTSNPADTLVAFNDSAADTVALSTSSEKIGGCFEVIGHYDGTTTRALVVPMLWEGQTMTIVS